MKLLSIPILFLTGTAFSALMVLESQAYYQGIYQGPRALLLSWLAAVVTEVAMHWMVLIRIDSKRMNAWFKILMTALFLVTVGTAWLHVGSEGLRQLAQAQRDQKLEQVLQQGLEDDRKESSRLASQNQRTNLALAAQARRENQGELVELLKKSPVKMDGKGLELVFLLMVRLLFQAAGLTCMWGAGHFYRHWKLDQIQLAPPTGSGDLEKPVDAREPGLVDEDPKRRPAPAAGSEEPSAKREDSGPADGGQQAVSLQKARIAQLEGKLRESEGELGKIHDQLKVAREARAKEQEKVRVVEEAAQSLRAELEALNQRIAEQGGRAGVLGYLDREAFDQLVKENDINLKEFIDDLEKAGTKRNYISTALTHYPVIIKELRNRKVAI